MLAKKILALFTALVLVTVSAVTVLNVSAEEGTVVATGGDVASGGDIEESTEETMEESSEETTEESSEATTEESSEAATEESSEATTEESSEATTEESSEAATEESSEATTEESNEVVYEVQNVEIKAVDGDGEAIEVLNVDVTNMAQENAQKAEELKQEIKADEAPGEVAAFLEVEVITAEGVEHNVSATLTFKIAGIKASDKVTVVHWPTDADGNVTGEVEYITPDEVRDGEIDVTFTSLSPIAIVVEKATQNQPENPTAGNEPATNAPAATPTPAPAAPATTPAAPATGDSGYGMTLIVCLMAFGVGLAAVEMKKKFAR